MREKAGLGETMSEAKECQNRVFGLLRAHESMISEGIPLIASENVTSGPVRRALDSDFMHRYAEGWVGERVYAGCRYVDAVESECMRMMSELFDAKFVDVRPISGVVANLAVYTAFTRPGDTMMSLSIPSGGHISTGKLEFGGSAGAVHGLNVEYLPLDYHEMTIDVDAAKKKILELADPKRVPKCSLKLVMLGASVFLFPHPVQEIAELVHSVGGSVSYDAAHVAGLIAGGRFQQPLKEGADVMSLSTHKTFFGPQHGAVVSDGKFVDELKRAVFPGLVSNHHLNAVAALAVACAEMKEFGESYAEQVIRNAKALGQALHERGFKVLAEHKGFTESHQLVVDVTKIGDGRTVEERLEEANILVNRNLLPWDIKEGRHFMNPGGIRVGVAEVTRLGMREQEMVDIAEFVERAVLKNEDVEKLREDIKLFRKNYQRLQYCFGN
jgi:glycine hydroxymethyltransferase